MTIFLDLDETLIHAIPLRGGGHGKRTVVRCSDGVGFAVFTRPLAHKIIADCQCLGHTIILTTGEQDYAESVCRALGFKVDEILGREKYMIESPEGDRPAFTNYCPDSWFIDNAEPDSYYALLKIIFLGISPSRYVPVRTFNGRDPAKFTGEWDGIMRVLRADGASR